RCCCFFFFSSRRRHTRFSRDWSSDVCSSDLALIRSPIVFIVHRRFLRCCRIGCIASYPRGHCSPCSDRLEHTKPLRQSSSRPTKIGRASCRERGEMSVVAVGWKNERGGHAQR